MSDVTILNRDLSWLEFLLEDVIRAFLPDLYRQYDIGSAHAIRVTRDADLHLATERGPCHG